jgi:hypothetical protein
VIGVMDAVQPCFNLPSILRQYLTYVRGSAPFLKSHEAETLRRLVCLGIRAPFATPWPCQSWCFNNIAVARLFENLRQDESRPAIKHIVGLRWGPRRTFQGV